MLHQSPLDIVVQRRLADLERANKQRQLLALVPKSRYFAYMVDFLGAYLIQCGTWMRRRSALSNA